MGPAAAMTPCRIIAHRAGNDLTALRAVAGLADVAEADVHLFRGRLEVRHAKTIGPVPVLWERWHLVPRPPRALGLAEVLAAVPDGTGLMLDLKGPDPRLPRAVRAAIAGWADGRALVVSSRVWPHLATFRGRPGLVTMRSAGTRWQLRLLLSRRTVAPDGVVVHRRLLTPAVVAALRARADRVWTWPVDDPADAGVLVGWGVTGMISDAPGRLGPLGVGP